VARMEYHLAQAAILMLLAAAGVVLAIPIIAQLALSDALPKRLHIENWPLWLQIPFGAMVVLYIIVDVVFVIRITCRTGRMQSPKRGRGGGEHTMRHD
jgi:hypothetical protein